MPKKEYKKTQAIINFEDKPKKRLNVKWLLIPIIAVLIAGIAAAIWITTEKANGNVVSQVAITSMPNKLVYYVGEQPSYTGLAITTTLNNGTSFTEGPEACQFSGFNSEFAQEEQQITITYKEYTFVYTISIKEPPRQFSPLKSISLEKMPKTEYKVGDWLSVENGVLLLEYEDGSTRRIRLDYSHIYDFDTTKAGTYTITVKLREDGYLATCTYTITVKE